MIDIEVLNKQVNFRQIVLYAMEPEQTLFRYDIIKAVSDYAVSKGVMAIVKVTEEIKDFEIFQQSIFGTNLFIFDISQKDALEKYQRFINTYQNNIKQNGNYQLPNRIMICYDKNFEISELLRKQATVIESVKPNKSSVESVIEYFFRKNPNILQSINVVTVKEMLTNWIITYSPDIYKVSEIIDKTCYEIFNENQVDIVALQKLLSESVTKESFKDFHPVLFNFMETPNSATKSAVLDFMSSLGAEITPKTYYLTIYNTLMDFYIVNKELGGILPDFWSQYKKNNLIKYQTRVLNLLKMTQLINKYEPYLSETDTPFLILNWLLDKYLKSESRK